MTTSPTPGARITYIKPASRPAPSVGAAAMTYRFSRSADGKTVVDGASATWLEMHGLHAPAPFDLEVLATVMDDKTWLGYVRSLSLAMDADAPWSHEYPIRSADGERWLRACAMPLEKDGAEARWQGFVVDVTCDRLAATANRSAAVRAGLLMRTTTEGLHFLDQDGLLVDASQAFCRTLGYERAEMIGLHVSAWDPNWTVDRRWQRLAAADGHPVVFEAVHVRKDGRPFPVEVFAASTLHEGRVYVCGSSHDISHRKRVEDDLRMTATAFEARESMFIMDAVRRVVKVNAAFTQETGFTPEETIGRLPPVLRPGLHDPAWHAKLWDDLRRDGHWIGDMYSRRKNGEVYLSHITLTAVFRPDGRVGSYIGIESDVTLQKHAQEEAARLAYYDPLTGLPNRRLLAERVQHALRRSVRNGRRNALLFLDLDNFKKLNDSLGHEAGDLLLKEVAQRLLAALRESDTVARLAGDEFVVVLEDLDQNPRRAEDQARIAAAKIQARLNLPFFIHGWEHVCTPSIGLVLFGAEVAGFEELLKHADVAMYHAKAEGRNTIRAYVAGMQHPVRSRRALSHAMRQGLHEGAFFLEYQPQFDIDGGVSGAEALARWRHPQRGLVSPAEFVPLAEHTGLILELGAYVLEEACRQLAAWERDGIVLKSLAVNVSAVQVRDHDFVETVLDLLRRYDIAPARLLLEITETTGLGDLGGAFDKLQQLKHAGVRLSLDDFGVGHASLSYLRQLPFDQIKIDKEFVTGLPDSGRDRLIAEAILALGERLELEVVAEGVETEAQHAWLSAQGCRIFQGYLLSRPVSADAVAGLVRLGSSEG